jgi:hypothetical protein
MREPRNARGAPTLALAPLVAVLQTRARITGGGEPAAAERPSEPQAG